MARRAYTRTMLIDHISLTFDMPKKEATKIIDCIFSKIEDELKRDVPVSITNFGTFSTKIHKGHTAHINPSLHLTTPEDEIPETLTKKLDDYKVLKFKAAQNLRENINGGKAPGGGPRRSKAATEKRETRGRPKKPLTKIEQAKRTTALQMIREALDTGYAISTTAIAEAVHMPMYKVTRWRNEAGLSLKEVQEILEERKNPKYRKKR